MRLTKKKRKLIILAIKIEIMPINTAYNNCSYKKN